MERTVTLTEEIITTLLAGLEEREGYFQEYGEADGFEPEEIADELADIETARDALSLIGRS